MPSRQICCQLPRLHYLRLPRVLMSTGKQRCTSDRCPEEPPGAGSCLSGERASGAPRTAAKHRLMTTLDAGAALVPAGGRVLTARCAGALPLSAGDAGRRQRLPPLPEPRCAHGPASRTGAGAGEPRRCPCLRLHTARHAAPDSSALLARSASSGGARPRAHVLVRRLRAGGRRPDPSARDPQHLRRDQRRLPGAAPRAPSLPSLRRLSGAPEAPRHGCG